MIRFLKQLFGIYPQTNFSELVRKDAQIIDVRTSTEFSNGHIRGAVNIPLSLITQNLAKIKKDSPIIVCCASGVRSDSAKRILLSSGFKNVHNGGGWESLQQELLKQD